MKIGILGTGMIVKSLMQTIERLHFSYVALLGTPDTVVETRNICKEHGLDKYYLDYDEMLDSDIDTIYVALPNHLHAGFAKKALMHDKHVIIEKPITANVSQLKELIQIAKAHRRMLFEAINIHYMPVYHALKNDIGQVGDIKIVSLNYSQYSSRYDAFKRGNILPAFNPRLAGGAIMDLNVYNIHFAVGLFGKPERVVYQANIQQGIDTSGILILDYGTFKVSSIAAKDCKAPVTCSIQGEKGCIVIEKPVNTFTDYEVWSNDGGRRRHETEKPEHRLYYEFIEFQRLIETENWKEQEYMLGISLDVNRILEEARRQNGIVVNF